MKLCNGFLICIIEQTNQIDKCKNLWIKLQDDNNKTSFILLHKIERKLNEIYLKKNVKGNKNTPQSEKHKYNSYIIM
jgi:hypothetical protein